MEMATLICFGIKIGLQNNANLYSGKLNGLSYIQKTSTTVVRVITKALFLLELARKFVQIPQVKNQLIQMMKKL